MAGHNETGKQGEENAIGFLIEQGFEILHRNWRYSHYEIDIIARRGGLLHIIEVKTARANRYGHPEEQVTKKKFRFLLQAADEFLFRHPEFRDVQYDVLAITLFHDRSPEYFLIEDVYL